VLITGAPRVVEWRASGLTAIEFGAQHGIVASTLRWWAWRLERRDAEQRGEAQGTPPAATRRGRRRFRKPAQPALRIAKVVQIGRPDLESARASAVVIELAEGHARVTVERGADVAMATRLIRTLATGVRPVKRPPGVLGDPVDGSERVMAGPRAPLRSWVPGAEAARACRHAGHAGVMRAQHACDSAAPRARATVSCSTLAGARWSLPVTACSAHEMSARTGHA
jgi:hypothetical protein